LVVLIILALGVSCYFLFKGDDGIVYIFDGSYQQDGKSYPSRLVFQDAAVNEHTKIYEYRGTGKDEGGSYNALLMTEFPIEKPGNRVFTKDYKEYQIVYSGQITPAGTETVNGQPRNLYNFKGHWSVSND